MDFINIEAEIKINERAIKNRIEKSGFTKEQLEKAFELTRLKDELLEINEDGLIDMRQYDADTEEFDIVITANNKARHKMHNMFYSMCRLFDFDYEELIEIQRLEEETRVLKEAKRDGGFGIIIDGEKDVEYYLFKTGIFSKIVIYSWSVCDRRIKDLEESDIEEYILNDENVKEKINELKK